MSDQYNDYDKEIQKLLMKRNMDLEKAFHSNDPETILKAQAYLQSIQPKQESNMKSFIFSPEHEFYNSLGFKNHPTNISYQVLRNMARTPFIRPIITTRLNQVADFAEFTEDEQKKGWTIRPKRKPFQNQKKNLTDKDKRVIEDIYDFINNGGSEGSKWGNDTFETFLRKTTKDSLEIDQLTFEVVQNRRGMPVEFVATDGGTMRLAETYDDRESTWGNRIKDAVAINGYYPSYVQVYNQQVYNQYYPWELCFGMRNISTNIMNNGYGVSELEDMIQLVTYMLYGMQYNGNFFKQGSNPKGILNIKGGASSNAVQELKQVWRSTIAGVQNSHKIPIIEGQEVEWLDMQQSNKEMEFQVWFDFLQLLACSVYTIDPSELGFNFQKAAQMFGQDGQKQRLNHSQTKGLIPILKFEQRNINKYIVERLAPSYEFVWCGIEQEDKIVALDQDVKKSGAGFVSMEDMFEKYSGRKFNPEKDTILNQAYLSAQQMKMMGGDYQQEEGNDNPFSQQEEQGNPFQKSEENPFMRDLETWVDKNIIHKGE